MIKVHHNLFVGNLDDCKQVSSDFAVVHACKSPCHQEALGYKGNLESDNPAYLSYSENNNLYLNLVDMDISPDHKFMRKIIENTIDFIKNNIENKPVLIHCNKGQSRSPFLALIYLSRLQIISNKSFHDSAMHFIEIYPMFSIGQGLYSYARAYWEGIMSI